MKPSRLFQFLMIASLLLALGGSPAQQASAAKAQPRLVQMAAAQPEAFVRVIVQKMAGSTGTEARVAALGGSVTQDLHIINAFAAEMTAEAAMELARMDTVRWVSLDAPVADSSGVDGAVNTDALRNVYDKAIGADKVWDMGYQGSSTTVALVDSGIVYWNDFAQKPTGRSPSRVIATVHPNEKFIGIDLYGHGTHIAGILGGNGYESSGAYIGMAPKVKMVSVKISNAKGMAIESDVVQGLQWVYEHKSAYHIRVANISLNSSEYQSYDTSPLDAAVEILWFNGIVVVVSAGNNGDATLYPPANDPFAITVGAVDDKGTASVSDDSTASFSAYGTTSDEFTKPDLVAPGKNIVSTISRAGVLVRTHKENLVKSRGVSYFSMSGTSTAAPMVSGAVALLLQDEPNLTPDQVKFRLKATANKSWEGYSPTNAGAGYLDVYAAVTGTTTESANTGIRASNLLTTGTEPITWNSVGWNSVGWNSVGWNSVGWNSVGWNSVGWNSDYWGP